MTVLEELQEVAAQHYPSSVRYACLRAASEIESLQKDSANAYDALSNAQQERDELRRQNAALVEALRHTRAILEKHNSSTTKRDCAWYFGETFAVIDEALAAQSKAKDDKP